VKARVAGTPLAIMAFATVVAVMVEGVVEVAGGTAEVAAEVPEGEDDELPHADSTTVTATTA
jgi:hypothetical protein